MPRNGSGTYSLPQAPFVAGTVISSAAVNSDLSDIATALTGSLPRNGEAGMTGQLKLPDGSAGSPSVSFTTDLTTGLFKGGTNTLSVALGGILSGAFSSTGWSGATTGKVSGQGSTPIGAITDFAGGAAPAGWLLCFGQAISRTTYAALFVICGGQYGNGDGSTTFNLPDCRGRATYGQDNMGGSAAGRITAGGGNFDGTILGGTGGGQNQTLTLAQLPTGITTSGSNSITVILNGAAGTSGVPVTSTPGNVVQSNLTVAGGAQGITSSSASWGGASATSTGSNTINATSNNTSGSSHPLINPAIIFSKIIYVGV